ncbi:MAG: biosynthetic peptidoglycan transglycosylase [Spirochaetota bacterium]
MELLSAKPTLPTKPGIFARALRIAAGFVVISHVLWIGATSTLVFTYGFVQPPVTVLMAYRAWADGWKLERPRPARLRAVPSWLRSMLVSVEDGNFYRHNGLDFEAVKRAWEQNARLSKPLHGASTLTMQVARTLFLVPEKSYVRKYLEVLVVPELELFLGKARILELYFGYAEWGRGIFGIEAAARRYYGKTARELTRDEGARLVALLSSPIKYRPDNFGRSLILRERYDFLSSRYDQEGKAGGTVEAPSPAATLPEGGAPELSAPEISLPAAPSVEPRALQEPDEGSSPPSP